jgi:hypothetical protein
MKILPGSMQDRLLVWFLTCTSLLLIVLGQVLYYEVKGIILSSVDRTLHSKMHIVTELLHEEHGVS